MLDNLSDQTKGSLYCMVGILILSPDSLLVREVSDAPNFTVIFYRYFILATLCLIIFLYLHGLNAWNKAKEIGLIGLIAGIVWGSSNLMITIGFQSTAAANVLVINSSNPMFSSLFSWILLKEPIPMRTIISSLICIGAIILIFSGEIGNNGNIGGLLASVGASITIGLYFVLLRIASKRHEGKDLDFLPFNILAAYYISLICIMTQTDLTKFSNRDLGFFFLMGGFELPVSFILLTLGPSLISAPEVSLYTLIETVIGPIWVWLGGYEAPPFMAVYGGIAIIITLSVHSFLAIREKSNGNTINKVTRDIDTIEEENEVEI